MIVILMQHLNMHFIKCNVNIDSTALAVALQIVPPPRVCFASRSINSDNRERGVGGLLAAAAVGRLS